MVSLKQCLERFESILTASANLPLPLSERRQSPRKYLTRDSQLTDFDFVGFDVEGRVGDMESSFKELKDMVNSTLIQKKGRDDELEMTKTRGIYPA